MTLGQSNSELTAVLKELQTALLKHPAASQALIGSLAEEGREFIKTKEGHQIANELAQSELLRRVWRVWEATSLWMFDDKSNDILPSGYKVEMRKPSAGQRWRLVGTNAEGTFCHKPCTVSASVSTVSTASREFFSNTVSIRS